VTLALLLAAALAGSGAAVQDTLRLEVVSTAPLSARRLTESSGAATSALQPGVVWTHNDSGDGPFLYATDSLGRDLGRVRVEVRRAVDWEDLAPGPCLVVPGRCFYVGDIGDNGRRRRHIVVYRLREPQPPGGRSDTLRLVVPTDSLVLRYPDGAHDAEALVVTREGTLLLITKDPFGPAVVYRAGAERGVSPRTLVRVGPLDLQTSLVTGRLVTGAALSPCDSILVVRTYVSLHFFRLNPGSVPVRLGSRSGITIPVVEPQGEGVAFDGVGALVLTSEHGQASRGTITRLRIAPARALSAPRTH